MILVATSGSFGSSNGKGCPATYPTSERWSDVKRTCGEYFSVASLYGGGQSIRSVGTIFMVIPFWTRQYTPGETRSLTLAALSGVMTSPGFTCAAAGVASISATDPSAMRNATNRPRVAVARSMVFPFFGVGAESPKFEIAYSLPCSTVISRAGANCQYV